MIGPIGEWVLRQACHDALALAERLSRSISRRFAASILRHLADLGIAVAVDDFGIGYSNLSYLIDFPFQKLRIDRSFISRIDRNNGGAVVSTIVGLSRALGVRTIAEGVETEHQAMLLPRGGLRRRAGLSSRPSYAAGREDRG